MLHEQQWFGKMPRRAVECLGRSSSKRPFARREHIDLGCDEEPPKDYQRIPFDCKAYLAVSYKEHPNNEFENAQSDNANRIFP